MIRTITSPRRTAFRSILGESVRRIRARYDLTPQERHNLHLAHIPPAVVTASLGGHTNHR
ncbi:hypothetical protein [Nocardia jiangxiensis]|uniref:DUF3263 domain-containing protein n=1 Tax=Nocardia jiangxiensis TaxID=282685 RepID=A0ABW6S7X3_9NOCA|nr:hypothetical protein [Nocardia jiangxiensis]